MNVDMARFFGYVVVVVLGLDVALHLAGKPTISKLVHGLANQYVDYGIYAVIVLGVFLQFGLDVGLLVATGCLIDHLFGERKNDLK